MFLLVENWKKLLNAWGVAKKMNEAPTKEIEKARKRWRKEEAKKARKQLLKDLKEGKL